MANHPANRGRKPPVPSAQPTACPPSEPTMRRWPHPVDCADKPLSSGEDSESVLRYLHCTLSYQNQLLAEIKTLLETLALQQEGLPEEK